MNNDINKLSGSYLLLFVFSLRFIKQDILTAVYVIMYNMAAGSNQGQERGFETDVPGQDRMR